MIMSFVFEVVREQLIVLTVPVASPVLQELSREIVRVDCIMASNKIPWFVGEPVHEKATDALLFVALTES